MVAPPLRAVMLAAEGVGRLEGDAVRSGRAEHPVCGDVVEVDLSLADGRVAELRWRASGCPATTAVCAAAPGALRGLAPADLAAALARRLGQLGGLAPHERHAERLFLDAVRSALAGGG